MANNTVDRRVPAPRSSLRGCLAKALFTGAGLLVVCGLLSVWFVPYAQYKSSHDIPNPFWGVFGKTVTYTPEQGPPSPDLVVTHPETVVLQYIGDYRTLAGTYPCVQDLAKYSEGTDPVLEGQPCSVHRPIASVTVRSVHLGPAEYAPEVVGPFRGEQSDVHVEISYADGTQHAMTISVRPYQYQYYWFTYLHMDCWSSLGISSLYPTKVSRVPKGAKYGLDTQGNPLCQR